MGVTTGVRPVHSGRVRRVPAEWSALFVAVAVTVVIGLLLPYEPDRVTVVIENPTDQVLYLHASTPDGRSRTMVGIISPQSTIVRDVIDRGPDWVLHVETAGVSSGLVDVSRSELVGGSFAISIGFDGEVPSGAADTP